MSLLNSCTCTQITLSKLASREVSVYKECQDLEISTLNKGVEIQGGGGEASVAFGLVIKANFSFRRGTKATIKTTGLNGVVYNHLYYMIITHIYIF